MNALRFNVARFLSIAAHHSGLHGVEDKLILVANNAAKDEYLDTVARSAQEWIDARDFADDIWEAAEDLRDDLPLVRAEAQDLLDIRLGTLPTHVDFKHPIQDGAYYDDDNLTWSETDYDELDADSDTNA